MLQKFKNHIENRFPFLVSKKIILAASGGVDSMVLIHLLNQLGYDFAIAHCNFQLRGIESFEDQQFVKLEAENISKTFFTNQFDTEAFASDFGLSIQMAARELRYHWFYELLEVNEYDYIITAHHADDNLETFIINLSRGTGLDGLAGIPEQTEKLIRPLLPFSRLEIHEYALANSIGWREDSSNASTKYLRNKIRHEIVPVLKEINPKFLEAFQKTQSYLQESQAMVEDASIIVYQNVVETIGNELHFDLNQLNQLPNYKSYLFHWLREYGFVAWDDVYNLVDSQSGKQVFSGQYRLIKNRQKLILCPIESNDLAEYLITQEQNVIEQPIKISFCEVTEVKEKGSQNTNTIYVDAEKLVYPLVVRKAINGEVFQPIGMGGKSKKISKFFKDEKLSLTEKENTWLLCSADQIIWVVGKRADERFKITNNTITTLKITFNE